MLLVVLALVGTGIWLPTGALATPTVYNFTTGSVTVTGTAGATVLFADTVPLTGTSVTFDTATPSLDDFLLVGGTTATTPLSIVFGGFDSFTLDMFSIVPALGYTNLSTTMTGPGTYSFAVGGVDVSGSATAMDSSNTLPDTVIPFGFMNPTAAGTLDINTGILDLQGVTLGSILVPGEADPLIIKADILFTGLVPEPGTGILVGIGLAGLAYARRRL
jgi:hypothetical protein